MTELVFFGGAVWTGDPALPSATAVATSNGRITAVGEDAEVLAHASPAAERIDLGGRLLCPGFIDAHTHFENACDWFFQVPVTGVTDGAELRARVARTLVGVPPGVWVTGGDLGTEVERPAGIDDVSPANPVLLRRADGRYLANTMALRIARLAGSGGLLERRTGEVVQRMVAPVSLEQKLVGARGVMASLNGFGITSIHDIARHPAVSERSIHSRHVERSYSNLAVFEELHRRAELAVRVYAFLTLDTFEGLASEGIGPGSGDEWLSYGALKIFLDSGVMLPPFDPAGGAAVGLKGDWSYRFLGEEKLGERIVAGDRAGFDIGVHVQGDAAIRLALDCFEHAARVNPERDRRHRLIHAWHLAEDDFARAAALGMVADVTADHLLLYSRGLDALLGEKRAGNAFAWRRMVDAGIVTNLVSDLPGAFDRSHIATVDPLRNMYVALTRDGFHPEQALRIDDVLRAYTTSPAYSSRTERLKGTVTPGKLADLVVLSEDITRDAPYSLLRAGVDLTVLAGEIVYRR